MTLIIATPGYAGLGHAMYAAGPDASFDGDYSQLLTILNTKIAFNMREFIKHCESFYKPSEGLSSEATVSIAAKNPGCSNS
jgi:hypothetical protein